MTIQSNARPTEAETKRAEADAEALRRSARQREWEARVSAPASVEECEREQAESEGLDPVFAASRAEERAGLAAAAVAKEIGSAPISPDDAAHLADILIAYEDKEKRVRAVAAALVRRAEQVAKLARACVWPALVRYCAENKRSTAKGWTLPWTKARLQMTSGDAKVEVKDREKALEWVEREIGLDAAIERDVVKVVKQVSEAKLRDEIVARKIAEPEKIPGIEFTPAGDRLGLRRG